MSLKFLLPYYFHHCCLSWNKLIFSCLGYFNNLLIGLPAYEFCPLQSATRIIFQKQKWLCHSAEKPLLASLSIKISFKFCSVAQSYFTSLPQPTFQTSSLLSVNSDLESSPHGSNALAMLSLCSFKLPYLCLSRPSSQDQAQMLPTLRTLHDHHCLIWSFLALWFWTTCIFCFLIYHNVVWLLFAQALHCKSGGNGYILITCEGILKTLVLMGRILARVAKLINRMPS